MRKLVSAFHCYHLFNDDTINGGLTHHVILHDQIINNNGQQIPAAFDFATLVVIVGVLLLSVISLSFIFHLRLKRSPKLIRLGNNLWSVRVLLVLFISHWAINEIIRLPFFRRHYLFPSLTLSEQDDLCKLHVVFSLGFLEPGYLITLLFIINQSLKEPANHNHPSFEIWLVLSVLLLTLPTLILQIISVLLFKEDYPTSMLTVDDDGYKSMTCTFPLLSTVIFWGFAVIYSIGLVLCCWRVVTLVINKKMRLRISMFGLTVIISLLVHSFLLGAASIWSSSVWYGGVLLGMFVSLAMGACVAEMVLVIKPILEALLADGDNYCKWNPVVRWCFGDDDHPSV